MCNTKPTERPQDSDVVTISTIDSGINAGTNAPPTLPHPADPEAEDNEESLIEVDVGISLCLLCTNSNSCSTRATPATTMAAFIPC